MKRIVYIIIATLVLTAFLGGVCAFADYSEENSTRVGTTGGVCGPLEAADGPLCDAEDAPQGAVADTASESGQPTFDDDITEGGAVDGGREAGENATNSNSEIDGNEATGGVKEDTDVTPGESLDGGEDTDVTPGESLGGGDDLTETAGKTNPFEAFFSTVKAYATEIFCALTFVGSLLLAYAYKCGLIPLIKGGIGALSGTVSRIRESAERSEEKTAELNRVVCDRLMDAEEALDGISDRLTAMSKKLDALDGDKDERKMLRIVMAAEVDMLYSIFMTSSLPQYQKDEVGEKIAQMREALGEYEER